MIITKMIPDMGFHYLNPKITGFNVRKPQILVYEHTKEPGGSSGRWSGCSRRCRRTCRCPTRRSGSFPAACHYADGTFIPDKNSKTCAKKAPVKGATFTFWHPDLITMHLWAWYPNPAGLFSSMNPLVAPFNKG